MCAAVAHGAEAAADTSWPGRIVLSGDDNGILIDYVRGGGNVFLAGGTNMGGAVKEAERWNPFLNAFGLSMEPKYEW